MTILGTIVIGFLLGLIAGALTPEKSASSFIIMTIVAIAGATLGRLIGGTLGLYVQGAPENFVVSTIGAVLLIVGYRYVTPLNSPGRA